MFPAKDPRPLLGEKLQRLLDDLCTHVPALGGISGQDILVVAVSAHGRAAASIRSLRDVARGVSVGGRKCLVELALRPPFFLDADPARRVATLVHELLHLDPRSPGDLLEAHRHRLRPHAEHDAEAQHLAEQWLQQAELSLLAPLGHDGEVMMPQWRTRPVPETASLSFSERDLFLGPVVMQTPADHRTVWW